MRSLSENWYVSSWNLFQRLRPVAHSTGSGTPTFLLLKQQPKCCWEVSGELAWGVCEDCERQAYGAAQVCKCAVCVCLCPAQSSLGESVGAHEYMCNVGFHGVPWVTTNRHSVAEFHKHCMVSSLGHMARNPTTCQLLHALHPTNFLMPTATLAFSRSAACYLQMDCLLLGKFFLLCRKWEHYFLHWWKCQKAESAAKGSLCKAKACRHGQKSSVSVFVFFVSVPACMMNIFNLAPKVMKIWLVAWSLAMYVTLQM